MIVGADILMHSACSQHRVGHWTMDCLKKCYVIDVIDVIYVLRNSASSCWTLSGFRRPNSNLPKDRVQVANFERYNSEAYIRVDVFRFECDKSQACILLRAAHEKTTGGQRNLLG